MEEISARLNALEQGVRERDADIQHLNTMLQQSALQTQSSTTSVPQPDLHREMLARVKEFDGDDDKWHGWWFKLQSFLKANHLVYEGMIERIVQETDGPKGKGKTKGKSRSDDKKGKGKAKGKGKNGKETRVCHECNKPGHLRKDCTVYKKRMAEKGGNKREN